MYSTQLRARLFVPSDEPAFNPRVDLSPRIFIKTRNPPIIVLNIIYSTEYSAYSRTASFLFSTELIVMSLVPTTPNSDFAFFPRLPTRARGMVIFKRLLPDLRKALPVRSTIRLVFFGHRT